jgi:hypothetical protein
MNVVHLDIVINIAYGKFSMKVYDIIVEAQTPVVATTTAVGERILKSILGHAAWSSAQKIAFKDSVELCTDAIEKLLLNGTDIATPAGTKAAWFAIQPRLAGTPWATRDFVQEVFNVAKAEAEDRVAKKASALTPNSNPSLPNPQQVAPVPVGSTPASPSPTTQAATTAVEKTTFKQAANYAANSIITIGLFANVNYVLRDPDVGYFPSMQNLTERLNAKKISPELFKKLHDEQIRLATGRLAWATVAPFAAVNALKLLGKIVIKFPIRVFQKLKDKLSSFMGGEVPDRTPKNGGVKITKYVYATYVAFLNTDTVKDLITTIIFAQAVKESLEAQSGIANTIDNTGNIFLIANNIMINGLTVVSNIAEKTLDLAIDSVESTTGSTLPTTALQTLGLSKTPVGTVPNTTSTPPGTVPSTTNTPAEPAQGDAETAEFNPADWKQTSKSGFWQNSKTKEVLSPQDYQRKSQSQ